MAIQGVLFAAEDYYHEKESDSKAITKTEVEIVLLKNTSLKKILVECKQLFEAEKKSIENLKELKMILKLGSGSFGDVFLCHHSKIKKFYAVKRLNKTRVQEMD